MEYLSKTYKMLLSAYEIDKMLEYQTFGRRLKIKFLLPKVKVDYSLIPLAKIDENTYSSYVSKEIEKLSDYKRKRNFFVKKRKSNKPIKQRIIEIIFTANSFEEAEKIGLNICGKYMFFFPLFMKNKVMKRILYLKTRQ